VRKLTTADVRNIYEYEGTRAATRERVIALKRARRVQVGPHLSFLFENRETVLFQIQEMCRTERIVHEAKVREEVDVYNELVPDDGQLSATLFIEVEDAGRIKEVLDGFIGIDTSEHVWIEVGDGHRVPGRFEAGRSDEERGKISAVHFVKFTFTPDHVRAFREAPVFLLVDHPGERARVQLPPEVRAALLEDLAPAGSLPA
jgi:hypothetical protein